MIDILFINPYPDLATGINEATISPPLGLAYLAAVLRDDGFSVKIIDANVLKIKNAKLIEEIRLMQPRFIGISMNIITSEPGYRLVQALKGQGINSKIILGGVTPTTGPESCLERANADFLVIGEGENTLLELIRREHEGNYSYDTVRGIAFRKNGRIIVTPPRERIMDLDTLPFPAYEFLPDLRKYKTRARGFPVASIFTSRGCPYSCIFCNKAVFGRKITFYSVKRVLDEIGFLIKNYGARQIDVMDDNFIFNRDRAIEILDGIIKRRYKIYINLQNGVRADTIDEELIKKMRLAGVYKIGFGVESGDKFILKKIKKNLDLDKVISATRLAKKYGMVVYGFFILGLPGETRESMEKTIEFAIEMDPTIANFCIALPFPGAEMYDIVEKEGNFLQEVDIDCFSGFYKGKAFFEIGPTKKEDVEEMYKKAYSAFYLRPHKLFELLFASVHSFGELRWIIEATLSSQKSRIKELCLLKKK